MAVATDAALADKGRELARGALGSSAAVAGAFGQWAPLLTSSGAPPKLCNAARQFWAFAEKQLSSPNCYLVVMLESGAAAYFTQANLYCPRPANMHVAMKHGKTVPDKNKARMA